jgi:flagellar protein FlaI
MFINSNERIVVIEDTPELKLGQPNIVRMVASPNVDMDSLLRNALRMRPDRIIIGEVRGKEAISLFEAMNTGLAGCFGTLHANTAKECISRITNPPLNVPNDLLKALDIIVVMKVLPSGIRYVHEIAEVAGVDPKTARLNTLFRWDTKVKKCMPTGIPSYFKSTIAEDAGTNIQNIEEVISQRKAKFQELLQSNAGNPEFESILKSEL